MPLFEKISLAPPTPRDEAAAESLEVTFNGTITRFAKTVTPELKKFLKGADFGLPFSIKPVAENILKISNGPQFEKYVLLDEFQNHFNDLYETFIVDFEESPTRRTASSKEAFIRFWSNLWETNPDVHQIESNPILKQAILAYEKYLNS
ncbi:MAG: hypothetical protein NZZ41_06805 [Candidatus Dojkabacteria bacterium]|nr:hypothetical protein [Candidatus Dojkabacteria bacterium]